MDTVADKAGDDGNRRRSPPARGEKTELVWDRVVRLGHWSLAGCVSYSMFAEPDFPGHDISGYVILAIVLWRWVWGFVGSPYARFRAFVYSPGETLRYMLSAFRMGEAREYSSHNPMGALMVFALLVFLPVTCGLGIMLLAAQQLAGPLAGVVPVEWDYDLEILHQYAAYAIAGLVGVHLLGTAWASWWHRENYLMAMITGRKNRHKRRRKRSSAADRRGP
ncbi:MAG: cytochrome b/b6 domain-containing protein [Rhodocyclaceae bacterium]|nr:cytochrome b/b6 domain-containing protein [Rhodocyclaceae bacterium]